MNEEKREREKGEDPEVRRRRKQRERYEQSKARAMEAKEKQISTDYHKYDIRKYATEDYEIPVRIRVTKPEDDRCEDIYF